MYFSSFAFILHVQYIVLFFFFFSFFFPANFKMWLCPFLNVLWQGFQLDAVDVSESVRFDLMSVSTVGDWKQKVKYKSAMEDIFSHWTPPECKTFHCSFHNIYDSFTNIGIYCNSPRCVRFIHTLHGHAAPRFRIRFGFLCLKLLIFMFRPVLEQSYSSNLKSV